MEAQRCKAAGGIKVKGVNAKDSGDGGEGEGGGALSDLVVKSSGVSTPEFDPVLASLFANPIQNKTLKTAPTYSNPKNTKKVPTPALKEKMERESQSVMSRPQAQGQGGSKATTIAKSPVFSKNNESPRTKTLMRNNRIVKTINSSSTPTHFESEMEMENNPEKKPLRLSNRDAAKIRVGAKAKFHFQDGDNHDDNEEGESLSMDMDMDDKDQDGNDVEEEDNATTPTAAGKKSPGEIKKSLEELNAPKDKNPELESRTVFVGNVPKTANKKQLLKLFLPSAEVEILRLRRGAAYIRFKTREEAEAVVAKSKSDPQGVVLGENRLILDLADNSIKDNTRAIFIGGLHKKSEDDEDELRSLFESCGMVESVRIMRYRPSGLGKGYGFVNFTEAAAVEIALKKDGLLEFKNRALRIKRCMMKQKVKEYKRNSKKRNKADIKKVRVAKQLTRPVAVDDTGRAADLPVALPVSAPVGVASQSQASGIKIPEAVKNYKQKKNELRKLRNEQTKKVQSPGRINKPEKSI